MFPVGSEGSGIPVFKGFIVAPVIRICGFPLSKYLSFTSFGNEEYLNIVVVVVAALIIYVLSLLVVYF